MYICIDRTVGQRVVVSSNSCRFRFDKDERFFWVELAGNRPAKYDANKECIFFTTSDHIAMDFIQRKPIDEKEIRFLKPKKGGK